MKKLEHQLQMALQECERLKEENQQLRMLLKQHNITNVNYRNISSKSEKIRDRIKMYRSLFKGRDDVYAIRWEGDYGNKGYAPARIGKNKMSTLLPLTDEVIYDHLTGQKTIGIYPLLKENTCWF